MPKDKKFAAKADKLLKPAPTSMKDFLNDDENIAGKVEEKKSVSKSTTAKTSEKKAVKKQTIPSDAEKEVPAKKVRHEVRLDEDLSEKIRFALFENRIDKTQFFKRVIEHFFTKSEAQQKKILEK